MEVARMTDTAPMPLPILDPGEVRFLVDKLASADVELVLGSIIDMGGVARSKQSTLRQAGVFHREGLGASPSWSAFCIDNTIAFTPELNVVGDLRLRADLAAHRLVGDGLAWVPAELFTQDGMPAPWCARGLLRRITASLESHGWTARVGCEIEFVLTRQDGSPLTPHHWHGYGLSAVLDNQEFVRDLAAACADAGLPVEQIHAEYGENQWELSVEPTDPMTAADHVVLARLLTGQVARRHGLGVSFSPMPFPGGGGNGAHQHVSFSRDGQPAFSNGNGPHGLTAEGAAMIGGIVAALPEAAGVLAGSALSPLRLAPHHWAGAFACWGLENREAAVRLCADTPGNPHGASIEVKCGDPSANPYLAIAVILGLALDGVRRDAPLPPEVTRNPAELTSAEARRTATVPMPADQAAALDALAGSRLLAAILGEPIWETLLVVRRHEQVAYGKESVDPLTDRFRFAWSL
jgi:glutamine synthetase